MSKKIPNECGFLSQPRKSKRKSSGSSGSRRSPTTNESWYNNERDSQEPSEDEVPGMEYTQMFWQQQRLSAQHHHHHQAQAHPAHHNGQRLFTAMSDPSVCGYSAVPVTYAMEPVSLPPMYHLYQPVVRPNYRPYRGRTRTSLARMPNGPPGMNDNSANGYSSLQENGWTHSTQMAYQNGDYASLPPTANIDNKNNGDELSSEHRRYSDPGLGPADLPDDSKGDESDSSGGGSSITTVDKNNKMFLSLMEQMTKLKETNSQLFKELHQAKTDLETVKTELNQLKQNVPYEYQPGMFTDIIKEIRDASRAKEEAMLSKVKQLMECQKSTELEQLKSQLDALTRANDERVAKLEKEIASLRLGFNSSCITDGDDNDTTITRHNEDEIAAYEQENLALRRELQEARRQHVSKMKQQQQQQQRQPTAMSAMSSSSSDDDDDDDQDNHHNFNLYDNANSIGATKGPVTDL